MSGVRWLSVQLAEPQSQRVMLRVIESVFFQT